MLPLYLNDIETIEQTWILIWTNKMKFWSIAVKMSEKQFKLDFLYPCGLSLPKFMSNILMSWTIVYEMEHWQMNEWK